MAKHPRREHRQTDPPQNRKEEDVPEKEPFVPPPAWADEMRNYYSGKLCGVLVANNLSCEDAFEILCELNGGERIDGLSVSMIEKKCKSAESRSCEHDTPVMPKDFEWIDLLVEHLAKQH